MLLNKDHRFCVYYYSVKEFSQIQDYLYNNGFNWEIFRYFQDDLIKKSKINPIVPGVIFNFNYNDDFLSEYIFSDLISCFENNTKNITYKKYNVRNILLLEKINKLKECINSK